MTTKPRKPGRTVFSVTLGATDSAALREAMRRDGSGTFGRWVRDRMADERRAPESPAAPPGMADALPRTPPPARTPAALPSRYSQELLHAQYLAGALQMLLAPERSPLDADEERAWLQAHPVQAAVVRSLLSGARGTESLDAWLRGSAGAHRTRAAGIAAGRRVAR